MKKFFTLLAALFVATTMMGQMHGPMKFVGASNMSVSSTSNDNPSDTILFEMADMETGHITLPAMKGMQTIPSFTIRDLKFSMGADHVITFAQQPFSSSVTVGGEEKTITGTSFSGTYNMADHALSLTAVFKYGKMPLEMTYTIKSYYVKAVSGGISVSVGGAYTYDNKSVTYQVRKYMDGNVEKVDVEVPTYALEGTIMGDLTLGSYVVKGLTYDETRGGFYRDYKGDGLSFHFTAMQGGTKTMDGDYAFNSERDNHILVKYNGSNVESIVNTFQMGAMPFGIVSTFQVDATAIDGVTADDSFRTTRAYEGKAYNLAGQRVSDHTKGVVIVNGKKYLRDDGLQLSEENNFHRRLRPGRFVACCLPWHPRRSLRPARGGGGSRQGSVAYRRDELDGLVLCRSQAVAAVECGGEGGRSAKGPNRMDALPYSYVAHR